MWQVDVQQTMVQRVLVEFEPNDEKFRQGNGTTTTE
jgi:hypothetical protein